MPKTILVVDDSASLRKVVTTALERQGYRVLTAADGAQALAVIQESLPDMVLTDADMPELGGHALCRILKKGKETRGLPIVIMSGELIDDKDVVSGLESGADDYILKPLSMPVLFARLGAVLRRFGPTPESSAALKSGGLEVDPVGREVKVAGKPVPLTRREFDLLLYLVEQAGKVVPAGRILENVWGYDLTL